ncbi:MAG: ATP-dependent helicase [Phycisphaerae bacterium]|nr:ATP-dependent helicase [Phycisphaerae bacterium]
MGLVEAINKDQQRAIDAPGPVMVLAGPGTGKTRVITHRIERLVRAGAEPESILALTFTVKAAGELRGRLAELIGAGKAERVRAHTFHGFGRQVTQRFADVLGLPPRQVLVDRTQRMRMVLEAAGALRLPEGVPPNGLRTWALQTLSRIDAIRHGGLSAERALAGIEAAIARAPASEEGAAERARLATWLESARVYEWVDRAALARGHLDFEHFILLPIRLMREHESASAILRDEIEHVVVDEFQDVNTGQIEWLRLLAPPSERRPPDLCVVGDDDQAIYMFRGADDRAMARFAQVWPGAARVALRENYRSGARILEVAGAVIARAPARFAPEKEIVAARAIEGVRVERVATRLETNSGEAIAAMIRADMATRPGAAWRDYAVIVRTNRDLDCIAAVLEIEEVPFVSSRGRAIDDDPGMRDLRAWIHAAASPDAVEPVFWLLTRPPAHLPAERAAALVREHGAWVSRQGEGTPIGFAAWLHERQAADPAVARFLELRRRVLGAVAGVSAEEVVPAIVRVADLAHADLCPAAERERRVEGLVAMMRFAAARAPLLPPPGGAAALHDYLTDIGEADPEWDLDDRVEGVAGRDDEPDAVRVMTAHGAKGLEFDTVFVARVCPPHGFPKTGESNLVLLPDSLAERVGDERTEDERAADEERRLLYVACTRAKRRLVLLAKQIKGKSTSTHYLQQLDEDLPEGIPIRSANDVLEEAARAGVRRSVLVGELATGDAADRLAREARLQAGEALDALAATPDSPGALDVAMASLRRSAERLAAVECARRGRDPAALGPGAAEVVEQLRKRAAGPVLRPLTPPLRLSYSHVRDYLRCGRCFYLRRVLGCPEVESARQDVGNAVHQALKEYFDLWRAAEAEGRPPPGVDRLLALGRREYERSLGLSRPMDALVLRQIEGMLRTAAQMHRATDQILELEWSLTFPYEREGVWHQFTAKFDRVDSPPQGGHRIIDYKTGAATQALLEPPEDDLQLGVYALALRHHQGVPLEDRSAPAIGTAEYWHLPTGQRGVLEMARVDYDAVRDQIGKAIDGMLEGRFERGSRCEGGPCAWLG